MTNTPDQTYRGARLGVPSRLPNELAPGRVNVRRIRLNSGGYEPGGRVYWGIGKPLFHIHQSSSGLSTYVRAVSREAALALALEDYRRPA